MKRSIFTIFLLFFVSLKASALQCVDLFSSREPHYPGSVYAKFPSTALPKIFDTTSLESLEKALNQMTMEVAADLPLSGLGAKGKKIEMDIDVEELRAINGSIISRLSTTLKFPQVKITQAHAEPTNFNEHNSQANSLLAFHIDMINAAIKSSLGNLQNEPLKIESGGLKMNLTAAPSLKAVSAANKNSDILIQTSVTLPRESIAMSGLVFKHDIVANVGFRARFVLDTNNSVSLKIISVDRSLFSLDAETLRFSESKSLGRTLKWFIEQVTSQQIEKFNRNSATSPVVIKNLFRIPNIVANLNIRLLNIFIDNDGYLKVELNIDPQNDKESNIKVKIKNRE